MPGVELNAVSKSFGRDGHAVKDVTLSVKDGEFLVLVGPSGCGKSTLLRMVAGLEEVTAGEIRIGQRVVNDVPPRDRDVAMVFQNYALYPHMTVFENLAFGLKLRKVPREVTLDAERSGRGSSRAASASAWRSAAPWCASRRCFFLMSHSPIWTPGSGSKCGARSGGSIIVWARR